MNVVLISTYELGRQPFGIASPAAWLKREGATVACLDLAVESLAKEPIAAADLVAFHIPMHTATRIAVAALEQIRAINPNAHLCFYGLYAPMNESYLRKQGADTIIGGEFEDGLVSLVNRLEAGQRKPRRNGHQEEPVISLARQEFLVPDRSGLPGLDHYARLQLGTGEQRVVGYTEASRGCKHLCRHCPVVPVYGGRFRVIQQEVVLEDINRQVDSGAEHITFGDPDFFNGPTHAVRLIKALHAQWPHLTYDVTIKVEHLLKHHQYLPVLKDTGCLFVISAIEAVDNDILEKFDKNHTREDFIRVVSLFREAGLHLNPTFVTFTPWTTLEGYADLLTLIHSLSLVDSVSPIQYAIRLLIPAGSKLLELPSVQNLAGEFDEEALYYPWDHPDPRVDQLCQDVLNLVREGQSNNESRRAIFHKVCQRASEACGLRLPNGVNGHKTNGDPPGEPVPFLTEDWYC